MMNRSLFKRYCGGKLLRRYSARILKYLRVCPGSAFCVSSHFPHQCMFGKRSHNTQRILVSFYCILLVACSDDNKDLTRYIHQVKQRKPSPILPLLPVYPESDFNYADKESSRNLFKQVKPKKRENEFASIPRQTKPVLEGYSLDTLKFVGILTQGQRRWGLIKGPDSQIIPVHVGDYIGKNHGKILVIKNNLMQLEETIKDSLDGWGKRVATLDLDLEK